ncbi:hypothetical protein G7Y79_00010g028350 [Physcia stellaris]|nr:hypothetical protein G7Y79_00010g028350 [Physcia stellaris]
MEQIRGLNSHGAAIVGTGVVFTVLSVTAVGLRFTSKRITRAAFGIDDWLLLASLAIYMAAEILYVYIYSAFTFPIVGLAQMSLLFLYRRLFYPSHLRYTTMILVGIVMSWLIAASTIEIGYPGHTIGAYFPGSAETYFDIDYLSFWLAMALIETSIEVTIMILPIREIRRLKLTSKQKHGLIFIFSLGGFVVITNIIRMAIIYRPNEPEFDLTEGNIWLNVHFGTAIISACLPTYKPLITRSARAVTHAYASHSPYKNGTRVSEDTHNLRSDKDKIGNPRTRQLREEISMDQMDHSGFSANARRSETSTPEWRDDGAVRAGEAIGVRRTVEVV